MKEIKELLGFMNKGVTPYQVVEEGKKQLLEAGFIELKLQEDWYIKEGYDYFVAPNNGELIAFSVGAGLSFHTDIRLGVAHTDYPMFRIKPNPQMEGNGYLKLNVEPYGGAIYGTWFDRPLSIAGKVVLKGENAFSPITKLVQFKKSIGIIPSLAIHMNRQVNKGVEINPQKELLPILQTTVKENQEVILKEIAKELKVKQEEILDVDLYVYVTEQGEVIGMNQEFISSPRIDNLLSVKALVDGLIAGKRKHHINMIGLFNLVEIGSQSKEGADSQTLSLVIEKIFTSRGVSKDKIISTLARSMYLSVDGAHGLHPNYSEKQDPTNSLTLGKGFAIKTSSSQRYVTDLEAISVIKAICEEKDIPYQMQVNRSDLVGGQTLGPILSKSLPMKGVDMGVPMLAMHSARELCHVKDYEALAMLIRSFFAYEN